MSDNNTTEAEVTMRQTVDKLVTAMDQRSAGSKPVNMSTIVQSGYGHISRNIPVLGQMRDGADLMVELMRADNLPTGNPKVVSANASQVLKKLLAYNPHAFEPRHLEAVVTDAFHQLDTPDSEVHFNTRAEHAQNILTANPSEDMNKAYDTTVAKLAPGGRYEANTAQTTQSTREREIKAAADRQGISVITLREDYAQRSEQYQRDRDAANQRALEQRQKNWKPGRPLP